MKKYQLNLLNIILILILLVKYGDTPLILAVYNDLINIVKELLNRDDLLINIKDNCDRNVLYMGLYQ